MNNLLEYIKCKSLYTVFICLLLIDLGLGHLFPWLCEMFQGENACNIEQFKPTEKLGYVFFVSVIVAPLLETLVCQLCIIELVLLYKGKHRENIAILSSGFVFALGHFSYGNYWFTLNTLISGSLLGILFLAFRAKNNFPFWITMLFHGLYNLYAILLDNIF
jgi:membrane protease YdiL (CAAX protease family)